jgi:hypothetical protein
MHWKENIQIHIESPFEKNFMEEDIFQSISLQEYHFDWKDKIRYQIQDFLSQISISHFQKSILFPIFIVFFILIFLYKILIFVFIEKKRYEEGV